MNKKADVEKVFKLDHFDPSIVADWLMQNLKSIGIGCVLSIALLLAVFRLTIGTSSPLQFASSDASLEAFLSQDPAKQKEGQAFLENLIKQHPEIAPKYEGILAQTFLVRQEPEQAKTFATQAFEGAKNDHLSHFIRYSQTSLLISEGSYEEALSQATQLDSQLSEENQLLFGFNTLRIAFLYQMLGKKEEELLTWQKIKSLSAPLYLALNGLFKDGAVSLTDYIKMRESTG